jgi:hypothetical protein
MVYAARSTSRRKNDAAGSHKKKQGRTITPGLAAVKQ